jgi:hypothetical protein
MTLHRLQKGGMVRGFPVSALRSEARKGRLELIQVANRHYVSDEAIDEMVKRCAVRKAPGLISKPAAAESHSGASVTERRQSALVYLKSSARKQSAGSPNT